MSTPSALWLLLLRFCLTQVFCMTGPGLARRLPTKPAAGGPGGFPPAQKKALPLSPLLSALRLSLSLSLFLTPSFCCPFPGSCSRGPSLPGRRTPLTRQADPPYPAGGPSLPGRRALLTRQADPPYRPGRRTLPSLPGRRQADTPYSPPGRRLLAEACKQLPPPFFILVPGLASMGTRST